MLNITIPARNDLWDPINECFVSTKEIHLTLEHSLLSVSKWESKWKKPYLSEFHPKTEEEVIDYIRCMTITQNVDESIYKMLSRDIVQQIADYINDPMTATTFNHNQDVKGHKKEIITSEVIYYWMCELNIPIECEKWHLNRLLTLVQVCSIKKQPPKKMGKKATMRSNAALNAARRQKFGSTG